LLFQVQRGKFLTGMLQFFIGYNRFGAGISLTGYWGLGIVVYLVWKKALAVSTVTQEQALIEGIRSEIPSVVAIYLFGSAVAGELRTDSDIDLAVLPAAPVPAAQLWSLAQGLAVSAGRDIDLIDLQSASTVMRTQVISTGKRLYCANELLCSNFEDRVYADYARLNEERRHILDDIRERGRIYG
jgi:predicted nucleotidyltransferase